MTLTLTTTQAAERLTVTLTVASAASLSSALIVVDGKAYTGIWTSGSYVFSYDLALERGPHIIYAQATDSVGTVMTAPITYVMGYELVEYGIDVYSGDAKLDALDIVLHDELLPALPTLKFSCATLLSGTIGAVIRERGLRKYQFEIATVGISGPYYVYTCKAAESYALTTAIMALQTAYGSTANAIRLLVPSLNIVGADLLAQTTYPQLFNNITPTEVIKQLLIQSLAQASVRNGNLYVFPLDVSGQTPDYHMQREDPLTGWQKDANVYDAVQAHYVVKQYPTPATVLTLHDAANWIGTVSDVTQVDTTLLPVSSGVLGMLKSIGNCSRAGLNAAFKNFDRIRFNWDPVTATSLTVSLQQDVSNKLEIVHTFAGQQGAGFILNTGTASTDILTKTITLSSVQFVTKVTGTTTANCSYRVTLLRYGGTTLWQDGWRATIGNTFEADVPYPSSESQTQTVIIEFKDLYLVDGVHYGVQCVTCDIAVQTWTNVGSHVQVDSTVVYQAALQIASSQIVDTGDYRYYSVNIFYCNNVCAVPALVGGQWYTIDEERADVTGIIVGTFHSTVSASGAFLTWGPYYWGGRRLVGFPATGTVYVTVSVKETVQDYIWVPSTFVWSPAFNLFESVDIALNTMTRTGNPVTLQAIVLTWAGDNYLDTLVLVADNPLPVTVRAGTGQWAYTVTEDFESEAGALAYANGLLPIVSVAREQYTRDVPLSTDLSVGDTVNCDGVPMTVYAADYRQDGKTIAAGRAMDILETRLKEQARRIGTLERKA